MLCLKGFSWCLILLIDLQSITQGEIIGRFIVAKWRFVKLRRRIATSETPFENRALQIAFLVSELRKSCTFAT